MINEVGINDKCGGYLRLIPLVLLLVPPTLLLVPPGGTSVFQCVVLGDIEAVQVLCGLSSDHV